MTGLASAPVRAGSPHPAAEIVRQAELAVQEAQAQQALWTTAMDALEAARKALAKEDFATADRLARIAIEQARLGIAQRSYSPLRF